MDEISHLSEDINYIYVCIFSLLLHQLSELFSEFLFFCCFCMYRAFQIGRFLKYLVIFGFPLSCKSEVQKYQRGDDLLQSKGTFPLK